MSPRRSSASFLSASLVFAAAAAPAQMHHVDAPERVTRAVGIYEWTGDLPKPTASRFVPVSLFIDGHFQDAGVYLARPVPFALQYGDVYAIEHAGEPEGLLDLDSAKRVVTGSALADDNPEGAWYGFGRFTPEAAPKPATPLHPSAHVGSIQAASDPNHPSLSKSTAGAPAADSDRPQMTRRTPSTDSSTAGTGSGSSGTASDSSGGSKPAPSTTGSTDSADDTDRPTLRKRDPAQDAARRAAASRSSRTASVTAAGPQLGDDPDRPTLSRGKTNEDSTPELTGMPADLHQAVAVSDAAQHDIHPFARAWDDPAERAHTLEALSALAKTRVAAYLAQNHLVASSAPLNFEAPPTKATSATPAAPANPAANADSTDNSNPVGAPPRLQRGKPQEYSSKTAPPPASSPAVPAAPAAKSQPSQPSQPPQPPQPATTAPARSATRPGPHTHTTRTASRTSSTSSTRPAPLTLRAEQISGYTLSYGGLPTFVYTAAASTALAHAADLPPAAAHPTVFVTLIAQRLPSGDLQVALDAVTDSTHLDSSPRLRLIDAVDPDASHRASLLFELRGANSRQFAFYRLTTAHAEQTFTTAVIE